MFEKTRRNGRRGVQRPPWRAVAQGSCYAKARYDLMCGFHNTIFDLTYLFNILFDSF